MNVYKKGLWRLSGYQNLYELGGARWLISPLLFPVAVEVQV